MRRQCINSEHSAEYAWICVDISKRHMRVARAPSEGRQRRRRRWRWRQRQRWRRRRRRRWRRQRRRRWRWRWRWFPRASFPPSPFDQAGVPHAPPARATPRASRSVCCTVLEHPTSITLSCDGWQRSEARRDAVEAGDRAEGASERALGGGEANQAGGGWERVARARARRGKVDGPREGAVPPCRPPAVCATRYHRPVMCVSLSRSHCYRSEFTFVYRAGGVLPPLPLSLIVA